jgi:hypothetical protein
MMENLKREIVTAVKSHWTTTGRPLLLSALGGKLSASARAERESADQALAVIIKEEVPEVRVIAAAGRGGAAVPVSDTLGRSDEHLEALLPRPQRVAEAFDKPKHPMIFAELWRLFRDGFDISKQAWVELGQGWAAVHILEQTEDAQNHWVEIKPSDLGEPDLPGGRRSPYVVGASVRDWAQKAGLAPNQYQVLRADSAPLNRESIRSSALDLEVLAKGLGVLSHEDLARINFPGDIVLKIISRGIPR